MAVIRTGVSHHTVTNCGEPSTPAHRHIYMIIAA